MDLSIVVPLLNEEESIRALHERIAAALDGLDRSSEIIYVDDGSTDATYGILKELRERDRRVKLVKLRRNFGQTPAMQAGFDHAQGAIIVSMDGDLQNDPGDIGMLVGKIEEGYDLVCGWRKNRKDKLIVRKFPSWVANRLIGALTGVRIHDTGCSLKAYRGSILRKTTLYADMHRFIPAMVSMSGVKHTEVPVTHHARQFGKSKYGLSRIWKVFLDLVSIKMLISFTSKPALWFAILSLPVALAGLIFGALSVRAYAAVQGGEPSSIVYPTVTITLLGLAAYLNVLGIFGEFIRRTSGSRETEMIDMTSLDVWEPPVPGAPEAGAARGP